MGGTRRPSNVFGGLAGSLLLALVGCGGPSPEKVCSHAAEVSKLVDENECKDNLTKLQQEEPQTYEARARCILAAKNEVTMLGCKKREEKGAAGEDKVAPAKQKWTAGQTVDIEMTLVKADVKELTCALAEEIAGKHCAFEAPDRPWSKGPSTDEKVVLQPYTTTNRIQFLGSGLWSEPALAQGNLPNTRFTAKCKLKIDGTAKSVKVRWEQTGQWYPGNEWYVGSLSACSIHQ